MASGNPKPAFYLAVFAVVIGSGGTWPVAFWSVAGC